MYIQHNELFTIEYKTIAKDASLLSSDERKYCRENMFQTQLCANLWCQQVMVLSKEAGYYLADCIQANGLINTIDRCQDDVQLILHDEYDNISTLGYLITRDASYKEALQLLRFPKRFTPVSGTSDLMDQRALNKFKNLLNELKMIQRHEFSPFLISRVKAVLTPLVQGVDLSDLFVDGEFSSGAVHNTSKDKRSKQNAWGLPYIGSITYPWRSDEERYYIDSLTCKSAKLVCVPKSYKTPRLIAEEESTRQFFLQAIRKRLEKMLAITIPDGIVLGHQEKNQYGAFKGSCDGKTATIDLSSASDRVTVSLFKLLFPANIVEKVMKWRSSTIVFPDMSVRTTQMLATSGSAVCFVIESIIFYSIAAAATKEVESFIGEELIAPTVYGDDIICDVRAYDTVCEWLVLLGFKVNDEKSYANGSFRESCGGDFKDGDDVTSCYWPRKPISENIASCESLIALHNALFLRGSMQVNKSNIASCSLLKQHIMRLTKGRMTTTSLKDALESDITDLIGYESTGVKVPTPYGIDGKAVDERDIHLAHCVIEQRPRFINATRNTMFEYVEYLMLGPSYDSPLDELLGVSSPRSTKFSGATCYEAYLSSKVDK